MSRKEDGDHLVKQLRSLHIELASLSKKSPHDAVNKFKLKYINDALSRSNTYLGNRKPFEDFSLFDGEDIPSNSDVTMMLAQYITAIDAVRFHSEDYEDEDEDDVFEEDLGHDEESMKESNGQDEQ